MRHTNQARRGRSQRGMIQGLSLVALTVLIFAVYLAVDAGWRPSGPGATALAAVTRVRKATAGMAAERRDPLPEAADGSLEQLVQQRRLDGKLVGGRLPMEGGGAVTRVRWVGVRNRRDAYVGISVEVQSPEILADLLERARRNDAFLQRPVLGLGCTVGQPAARATTATLCYAL